MKQRAFTLIELMVVVSIISLLASMILAALGAAHDKADNAYRIRTIEELQKGILLARDDLGGFPAPAKSEANPSNMLICLDLTQPCLFVQYWGGNLSSMTSPKSDTLNKTLEKYIKIQKQFAPVTVNTSDGTSSYPGPLYMCGSGTSYPTSPPYLCLPGDEAVIYYDLHGDSADCGPGVPSSLSNHIVSGHTTCRLVLR
ncbi:MAG: type II secretion system protein [Minisyncoccota bacterium]